MPRRDTRKTPRETHKPKINITQVLRTITQHKADHQILQERHKQPSQNLLPQENQNRQSTQNTKVELARLRPQPIDI